MIGLSFGIRKTLKKSISQRVSPSSEKKKSYCLQLISATFMYINKKTQSITEGKMFIRTLSDVSSRRPLSTKSMLSTFPSLESSFNFLKAFSLSSPSLLTTNERNDLTYYSKIWLRDVEATCERIIPKLSFR